MSATVAHAQRIAPAASKRPFRGVGASHSDASRTMSTPIIPPIELKTTSPRLASRPVTTVACIPSTNADSPPASSRARDGAAPSMTRPAPTGTKRAMLQMASAIPRLPQMMQSGEGGMAVSPG